MFGIDVAERIQPAPPRGQSRDCPRGLGDWTPMGSRIDWVIGSCRLLAAIGDEFERTGPFEGRRIGTGIHLEPKTVALLLTLVRGGADVVSTGNLNTTQQSAIDYLSERGVRTIGTPTADPAEHDRN